MPALLVLLAVLLLLLLPLLLHLVVLAFVQFCQAWCCHQLLCCLHISNGDMLDPDQLHVKCLGILADLTPQNRQCQ